ncbi:acyltransferase family protein, partial [Acinetobacter baumannii]
MGVPAQFSSIFLWGRWGVCFFFVLSGFIIAHVHWKDLGSPDRVSGFLWRRLVRIFPTYWLALAIFV